MELAHFVTAHTSINVILYKYATLIYNIKYIIKYTGVL